MKSWQRLFKIARSAPGAGLGLFARVPIEAGDFVIEYTGTRIPTSVADEMTTRYLFEINEEWTLDGSGRDNVARYINHSCEPNCESSLENERINIYALRDIDAGEELTFDYGDEYFDTFIRPEGCRCIKCRRSASSELSGVSQEKKSDDSRKK